MSANSEAIENAVFKWLDANKPFVEAAIIKGVNRGVEEVATTVGTFIAARTGRWLSENSHDIKAALAAQMVVGLEAGGKD